MLFHEYELRKSAALQQVLSSPDEQFYNIHMVSIYENRYQKQQEKIRQ